MTGEIDIPPAFRWAKWLAGVVISIVLATAATIAYLDRRIDERAEKIATAVMGSLQDGLRADVSRAAADGAERAMLQHVQPLESRVANLEGWRDGTTLGRLDTTGARR